jgi:hypothetical protein
MPHDPWFRRRPGLALALATVLFAAVLSLRLSTGDAVDAYSMLYAFPVALVATTLGFRAGVLGGVTAVLLIALWAVAEHVSLTPTGWGSRVLPLLLLGILLGDATDRARRAEADRHVQGMAAARWSLEAGSIDVAARTLDETIAQAQDLVSALIRRAGMGDRTEPTGVPEA